MRGEEARLARSKRTSAKVQLVLAVLWVGIAVLRWVDDDSDAVSRWLWTALAAAFLVSATVLWRAIRRQRPPTEG
jgi:hypothetical protein